MEREEILEYVLPVFLPDAELQEDNSIYDTDPEKLAVYEWRKLPVCFQSSREPKLYRNSDLSYYEIGRRTIFEAAVKKIWKQNTNPTWNHFMTIPILVNI